ncbi:hypothetical protein [Desulfosporosinus hippei]|uniref:Uncharacterized protein n=1 Tax=Desulfosporosinus hippei DSM 8344 TaxID=1121419 RepID=A0A1G7UJQ9_9FIRM|nr:hypothetical protein [Desulfosporosinus hippei]SDG47754.1 hypothetical protein SAMN05443529_103165 [Desulfosporosinus hippei DSM 8344]
MIDIFYAILGLCFFIVPVLAFREGIRVGMQANKGIEPPKAQTPIEAVKTVVKEVKEIKQSHEIDKAEKKLNDDISKMFNYSGGDDDGTG